MGSGNTKSGAGGNTTRPAPISWRPSPAAAVALTDLMQRTGQKRNELLNVIVIAAAQRLGGDTALTNDAPAIVEAAKGNIDRNPHQWWRSGVDPEKIAAFQRKTGMTVYDKRRNRG